MLEICDEQKDKWHITSTLQGRGHGNGQLWHVKRTVCVAGCRRDQFCFVDRLTRSSNERKFWADVYMCCRSMLSGNGEILCSRVNAWILRSGHYWAGWCHALNDSQMYNHSSELNNLGKESHGSPRKLALLKTCWLSWKCRQTNIKAHSLTCQWRALWPQWPTQHIMKSGGTSKLLPVVDSNQELNTTNNVGTS